MKRHFLFYSSVAIAAVLAAPPVRAQQPTTSTTVVYVEGVNCTSSGGKGALATSWSFGATNSGSLGSAGGAVAGKTTVGPFYFTKSFDECSASLFGLLASGRNVKRIIVTERNSKEITILTVELDEAMFTQYLLSDGGPNAQPVETFVVSFGRIIITNPANGSKSGWDIVTNKAL